MSEKLQTNPEINGERIDQYRHSIFVTKENPDLALKIRQLHAQVYLQQGLVKPTAIDDKNHCLIESAYKTGTEQNSVYYYAENPANENDCAAARIVGDEDSTLSDLPSFPLCDPVISDEFRAQISDLLGNFGCQIRELGALIRPASANHRAISEIIRSILHDTVGKNMILYCSMVQEVYGIMTAYFSHDNYQAIGDPSIKSEDAYLGRDIAFIPVIIDPDNFVNNIYNEYLTTKDDDSKKVLFESLLFMSQGMSREFFSDELNNFLIDIERNRND